MRKNEAAYMGRRIKVCGSVGRNGRGEKERGKTEECLPRGPTCLA